MNAKAILSAIRKEFDLSEQSEVELARLPIEGLDRLLRELRVFEANQRLVARFGRQRPHFACCGECGTVFLGREAAALQQCPKCGAARAGA